VCAISRRLWDSSDVYLPGWTVLALKGSIRLRQDLEVTGDTLKERSRTEDGQDSTSSLRGTFFGGVLLYVLIFAVGSPMRTSATLPTVEEGRHALFLRLRLQFF